MATLSDRIKQLRKEKNLTQPELGKIIGMGKTTISMYETGNSTPGDDIKLKMAEYFNVSMDYLMGVSDIRIPITKTKDKEEINSLTNDEKNILNLYKKLNDKDKAKFEGMMELKISEYEDSKKIISSTCPSIGEEIS